MHMVTAIVVAVVCLVVVAVLYKTMKASSTTKKESMSVGMPHSNPVDIQPMDEGLGEPFDGDDVYTNDGRAHSKQTFSRYMTMEEYAANGATQRGLATRTIIDEPDDAVYDYKPREEGLDPESITRDRFMDYSISTAVRPELPITHHPKICMSDDRLLQADYRDVHARYRNMPTYVVGRGQAIGYGGSSAEVVMDYVPVQ